MDVYGLSKQQQRCFYRNDLNKRFHSSEVKPLYRIHRVIVIKNLTIVHLAKRKKSFLFHIKMLLIATEFISNLFFFVIFNLFRIKLFDNVKLNELVGYQSDIHMSFFIAWWHWQIRAHLVTFFLPVFFVKEHYLQMFKPSSTRKSVHKPARKRDW